LKLHIHALYHQPTVRAGTPRATPVCEPGGQPVRKTLFSLAALMTVTSLVGTTSTVAQTTANGVPPLTDRDRAEIQELVTHYARALATCSAEEYAGLFTPVTGSFASSLRGEIVGREKLIALVQSEPHCVSPTAGRPVGNGPIATITSSADRVTGHASVGNAGHYEDVYVKTPDGWRFQSRNVITTQEEAANYTSKDVIELRRLAGNNQGYYDDVYRDTPAGKRLRSSGIVLTLSAGSAIGKAYLRNDGGHYDDVYVRTATGWRFKSRTYVARGETSGTETTAGQ
jgi:hypothetical protein